MKASKRATKASPQSSPPGRTEPDRKKPARRGRDGGGAVMMPGIGEAQTTDSNAPPPRVTSAPAGERTDEQLLDDYRHGDKAAFSQLVSRYQRELYHFLVRFLGNRAAAEDVFQESFLQVHQSAEQFDPTRRFRPWLFTIAANKARDLIRSQARRPTNPLQATISPGDDESGEFIDLMQSTSEQPSDPMEKRELQQLVHNTVSVMPEHLREILLLSYFHQFPYKQIGEILDIPLGTVKSRLHAAVAHFADRWRATNEKKGSSNHGRPSA
jgi:RNA polymerase sigma-70 factor (ECF subfamily)